MRPLAFLIGAVIVVASIFLVFGSKPAQKEAGKVNEATSSSSPQTLGQTGRKFDKFPGILAANELQGRSATIKTAKGDIKIEFFGSETPKAVSNFIFLILVPDNDDVLQVQILQAIARVMQDPANRQAVLNARDASQTWDIFQTAFAQLYVKKGTP